MVLYFVEDGAEPVGGWKRCQIDWLFGDLASEYEGKALVLVQSFTSLLEVSQQEVREGDVIVDFCVGVDFVFEQIGRELVWVLLVQVLQLFVDSLDVLGL